MITTKHVKEDLYKYQKEFGQAKSLIGALSIFFKLFCTLVKLVVRMAITQVLIAKKMGIKFKESNKKEQ